jgi:hypothetical protein
MGNSQQERLSRGLGDPSKVATVGASGLAIRPGEARL